MKRPTADLIAIVLSAGFSLSILSLVVGVSWAAIQHGNTAATLSDNEAGVLQVAFGGVIGVLGAWVGYRAGNGDHQEQEPELWGSPGNTVELPPPRKEER